MEEAATTSPRPTASPRPRPTVSPRPGNPDAPRPDAGLSLNLRFRETDPGPENVQPTPSSPTSPEGRKAQAQEEIKKVLEARRRSWAPNQRTVVLKVELPMRPLVMPTRPVSSRDPHSPVPPTPTTPTTPGAAGWEPPPGRPSPLVDRPSLDRSPSMPDSHMSLESRDGRSMSDLPARLRKPVPQLQQLRKPSDAPPSVPALPVSQSVPAVGRVVKDKKEKDKRLKVTLERPVSLRKAKQKTRSSDPDTPDAASPRSTGHVAINKDSLSLVEFFNKSLRTLCTAALLDAKAVDRIANSFNEVVFAPSAIKGNSLTTTPFATPEMDRLLNELMGDIASFLQSQQYSMHIACIQSNVRRWLVLRKLNLRAMGSHAVEQLNKRNTCFVKLMEVEKEYLNTLNVLIKEFLEPVRTSFGSKPLMEIQDMATVFSNVESLPAGHKIIHNSLQALYDNEWPLLNGLGAVLLNMAPSLKLYEAYFQNYRSANNALQQLHNTKKKNWMQFLSEKAEQGLELEKLLAAPVKQINTYEELISSIAQYTLPEFPDYNDIQTASTMMKKVHDYIKEQKARSELTAKVLNVQRQLIGFEGPNLVSQSKRRYKMEGEVEHNKKTKKLFLFNDLLLITRPTSKGMFKMDVKAVEIETCAVREEKASATEFTLTSGGHSWKFVTRSEMERMRWVTEILNQIHNLKEDKVFGVNLARVVERENRPIPRIVEETISIIVEKWLDVEGIFRVSADKKELESLKSKVDKGDPYDLTVEKVHTVTGLLKTFLRELPTPLFPYSFFDRFVSAQLEYKSTEDPVALMGSLQAILVEMPPCNLALLKALLSFWKHVVVQSAVNKMTAQNLAIVFGPNLLRPQEETLESNLSIPLVNGVVAFMMERSDEVLQHLEAL